MGRSGRPRGCRNPRTLRQVNKHRTRRRPRGVPARSLIGGIGEICGFVDRCNLWKALIPIAIGIDSPAVVVKKIGVICKMNLCTVPRRSLNPVARPLIGVISVICGSSRLAAQPPRPFVKSV